MRNPCPLLGPSDLPALRPWQHPVSMLRRGGLLLAALLVSGLLGPGAARSADPSPAESAVTAAENELATGTKNPHVWQPKTQSVAVFKNGLGFFNRRASVQLRDGWCYATDVPPAAFGTLAVFSHDQQQTVDLVGAGPGEIVSFDGHHAPGDLDSKRRRLQDSVGLKVELTYVRQGASRAAAGTLISIGPEYAVLEADTQTLAVALRQITQMQVLDLPLRIHVSRQESAPASQEADLGIAYLRKGITWIPEYTLRILDDETAELTLRGTLVNEAEDLVHCDVNFVVGVPHFVHSELMSPIAVGRAIRTLGPVLATEGVPSQVMSQIMNRAAIANNSLVSPQLDQSSGAETRSVPVDSGDLASVIGNLPQLESAAAGDFTVYAKQDLTVRRGERAIVTLFTQQIRYRHLYRWETAGPIQHFLTLENTTPTAWTTGPCLTLSEGNPLSEDLLRYTPRGGRGELKVTTAINIAHTYSEEEVDRKLKVHEPRNNEFYDLVSVAGSIRLKNFQEQPVDIMIEHPIQGRPTEVDSEGTIHIDATKLRLIERAAMIHWRLSLPPGQETVLKYRYERYVPSN